MNEEEIRRLLRESCGDVQYEVHCLWTTDSTNERIKAEAVRGADEWLVITAEEQTAGKGRMGRTWVSPAGEAVYVSFLLRPKLSPEAVSAVTLVMGLSVAQAVREETGLPVQIKWPNDVVLEGKKICGILTEAGLGNEGIDYVVVGTGINVNNRSFSEEIAERATSLRIALKGQEVGREMLLVSVLRRFYENYRVFEADGNLSGLQEAYNKLLVNRGREVRIEDPKGPYTAYAGGIDGTGSLIVTTGDGRTEKIACGEVSVRGIYGYV